MGQEAKAIRRQLKILDQQAELVEDLREHAKTEGGRTTEFGRAVLAAAKDAGIRQAYMARLLGISAGAVSQHYNK